MIRIRYLLFSESPIYCRQRLFSGFPLHAARVEKPGPSDTVDDINPALPIIRNIP